MTEVLGISHIFVCFFPKYFEIDRRYFDDYNTGEDSLFHKRTFLMYGRRCLIRLGNLFNRIDINISSNILIIHMITYLMSFIVPL